MNRQHDVYETARDLMNGIIYDAEDVTVNDAQIIADIMETQGYVLRVYPEFHLIAAIPNGSTH